jgi:putative glutamine amidotransferase
VEDVAPRYPSAGRGKPVRLGDVFRPLIAVSGRILLSERVARWSNDAIASPRGYTDAVERAGGAAALLPPVPLTAAEASDRLQRFDGLVLTGGADVNPQLYGEEPHPTVYGVDPVVDEHEIALARAAIDRGIPLLAICRGLQVLNVALGGTLDQHIGGREGTIAHGTPDGGGGVLHDVAIDPGTRLAKAIGVDRATCMSHHHQALARVADGLTITARAGDGIVEGAELDRGWVVGVQWHPEETAQADPVQQALFDALIEQAQT